MIEFTGNMLIFMLCSDCNINCEHCYIGYKENRDAKETLALVKELKKRYYISFNGSEVLMHPEYLDCYKEVGQTWTMSNGIVLGNKKIRDALKEAGIKNIDISYHMDMHDKISQVKSHYLFKLFETLLSEGFEIRIMTTITNKNYFRVLEFCEIAKQLKVQSIQFTNFLYTGNATNMEEDLTLNDEQVKTFFDLLYEARKIYPKDELYIARCGSFGYDKNHPTHFKCSAITDQVTITPDNKVYPCIFLAGKVDPIGELIDGKVYLYETHENCCNECLVKKWIKENR